MDAKQHALTYVRGSAALEVRSTLSGDGVRRSGRAGVRREAVGSKACFPYSGWNSATVLPSGSLNHPDFPTPAVVATWLTVFRVGKSYSSSVTPRSTKSFTSASTSLVQKR